MRKLLTFLLVVLLATFILNSPAFSLSSKINQALNKSVCDQPISYRIDFIDPKFGISKEEFGSDIKQAAKIWDDSINKNLFTSDPDGTLKFNLVFDERQSLNNQINDLESQLNSQKSNIKTTVEEYEKESADFKKRLADLNSQISYWNKKGGAPPEEYDKLIKERDDLLNQAERLNVTAKSLNRSADSYNAKVGDLNQTVESFNQAIQFKPEEGIYDPKDSKITIYFNTNRQELIHTLAHEMGHALGLEHIPNKKAIMFSYTNQQIVASLDDVEALKEVCQQSYYLELLRNNLYFYVHSLQNSLNSLYPDRIGV